MITDVSNPIFVFGSNLAGKHGAGAAKDALNLYGAQYGVGEGLQGRSYALPTKDVRIRTLPLDRVAQHVHAFLVTARENPRLQFLVTPVGTGLARYAHSDIAPLFEGAPANCLLPGAWQPCIGPSEWRLLLAGPQGFADQEAVFRVADAFLATVPEDMALKVVTDSASWIGTAVARWAQDRNVAHIRFGTEQDRLGARAGGACNKLMACYGTHFIAVGNPEANDAQFQNLVEVSRKFGLRGNDPVASPASAQEAPQPAINIFSGAGGLGSILTNPTELARSKGMLARQYAVKFRDRSWPDAEAAYQRFKVGNVESDDGLMAEIIAAKLVQHPEVMADIVARGGEAFLTNCSHWTGARTAGAQAWEGQGMASRFIRNLVRGFALAQAGVPQHLVEGTELRAQQTLF